MNYFGYLCPACGAPYQDLVEKAKTKLVHYGLISTRDGSKLPTTECVSSHSYVRYEPCGHCCPDVFGECSACVQGFEGALARPGQPSQKECSCHYCIEEVDVVKDGNNSATTRAFAHRADLHTQILDSFSMEEIRTICFKLKIRYENFPSSLDGLAREMILYCERAKLIDKLLAICRQERPNDQWQW